MEKSVKMISAVAEVFSFKKKNPSAGREKILQHLANFIRKERNKEAKIGMMVIASKTTDLLEKDRYISEKQVIQSMIKELPQIMIDISEDK